VSLEVGRSLTPTPLELDNETKKVFLVVQRLKAKASCSTSGNSCTTFEGEAPRKLFIAMVFIPASCRDPVTKLLTWSTEEG
jgi:hypothetical protein